MGWTSLATVFTPTSTVRDPETQRQLREEVASTGEKLLLRALAEGRLPGEKWRDNAACREPGKAELFFPQPVDPDEAPDDREAERVEFKRLDRLNKAFETCAACPVQPECLGWALRIAGSDKESIIAGTTWNQRKQILAELRLHIRGGDPLLAMVGWKQRRLILRDVRSVIQGGDIEFDQLELSGPVKLADLVPDERARNLIIRSLKGIIQDRSPEFGVPPNYTAGRREETAA